MPLCNPRVQVWTEHFTRTDGGARLASHTSTGRATIDALQLNRPLIVRASTLDIRGLASTGRATLNRACPIVLTPLSPAG